MAGQSSPGRHKPPHARRRAWFGATSARHRAPPKGGAARVLGRGVGKACLFFVGVLTLPQLPERASAVVIDGPTDQPGAVPTVIEFLDQDRARVIDCGPAGSESPGELADRVLALSPGGPALPLTSGEEHQRVETPSGEWYCSHRNAAVPPGTELSGVAIFGESPDGKGYILLNNPYATPTLGDPVSKIGNGPALDTSYLSPDEAYGRLGKAIGAQPRSYSSGTASPRDAKAPAATVTPSSYGSGYAEPHRESAHHRALQQALSDGQRLRPVR